MLNTRTSAVQRIVLGRWVILMAEITDNVVLVGVVATSHIFELWCRLSFALAASASAGWLDWLDGWDPDRRQRRRLHVVVEHHRDRGRKRPRRSKLNLRTG